MFAWHPQYLTDSSRPQGRELSAGLIWGHVLTKDVSSEFSNDDFRLYNSLLGSVVECATHDHIALPMISFSSDVFIDSGK